MEASLKTLLILSWLTIATLFALPAEASNLRFTVRGQSTVLIPANAISCHSRIQSLRTGREPIYDVPAFHFTLIDPVLAFESTTQTESAWVTAIHLKVEAPQIQGGTHQCTLEPQELYPLFGRGRDHAWNGQLYANDQVNINPTCLTLVCGNLQLTSSPTPFQGKVTATVVGLIKDSRTNSERPLNAVFSQIFRFSF